MAALAVSLLEVRNDKRVYKEINIRMSTAVLLTRRKKREKQRECATAGAGCMGWGHLLRAAFEAALGEGD